MALTPPGDHPNKSLAALGTFEPHCPAPVLKPSKLSTSIEVLVEPFKDCLRKQRWGILHCTHIAPCHKELGPTYRPSTRNCNKV